MSRKKHQSKAIESALKYAEKNGWTVLDSGKAAHSCHIMRCATNSKCRGGDYCSKSIWSTPRSAETHSRQIKQIVDKCEGK